MEIKLTNVVKIDILEGEHWYGLSVSFGAKMPFTAQTDLVVDMTASKGGNAHNGALVSSAGRYAFISGYDYILTVKGGVIEIKTSGEVDLSGGFGNLKNAYLALAEKHFKMPENPVRRELFLQPQFCSWAAMDIHVSDKKVRDYIDSVVKGGMPYGVFLLDDGWMRDYGDWYFDENKIANPKALVDYIHSKGFKAMLWLVPFVKPGVPDYDDLAAHNAFIRDEKGDIAIKTWWNGDAALLDFTNDYAVAWMTAVLDRCVNEYGFDGFKFDGGSSGYIDPSDVIEKPLTPNEQSRLWGEFALKYEFSELRECVGFAVPPFVVRLNDKRRLWLAEENGLGGLVPGMLAAGVCGYPFTCADMVGGGGIGDFQNGNEAKFEADLVSRFCECSALFPSMQFSYPYWDVHEELRNTFLKYALLHESLKDYIGKLMCDAETRGEPIVRYIEYEFPHEGFEKEINAFMLGSDYLVSPVVVKNQTSKQIALPKGKWLYVPTGETFEGGKTVTVPSDVGTLPYFKKM